MQVRIAASCPADISCTPGLVKPIPGAGRATRATGSPLQSSRSIPKATRSSPRRRRRKYRLRPHNTGGNYVDTHRNGEGDIPWEGLPAWHVDFLRGPPAWYFSQSALRMEAAYGRRWERGDPRGRRGGRQFKAQGAGEATPRARACSGKKDLRERDFA